MFMILFTFLIFNENFSFLDPVTFLIPDPR